MGQALLPGSGQYFIECIVCRDDAVHAVFRIHYRDGDQVVFTNHLRDLVLRSIQLYADHTLMHELGDGRFGLGQ